ncbi:MAG: hypothetical protein U0K81_05115 [Paludibacteraceae bacterium]|nr:hypothetical protein [Paludibacteraceae bacterium]
MGCVITNITTQRIDAPVVVTSSRIGEQTNVSTERVDDMVVVTSERMGMAIAVTTERVGALPLVTSGIICDVADAVYRYFRVRGGGIFRVRGGAFKVK